MGAGTLGGTTTATTDASGSASFTNLSITGPNGVVTLRFTSGALIAATSNAINITGNSPPPSQTYTTGFFLTEFPISEAGRWINGRTNGLDWSDVWSTGGKAIGRQNGPSYTDATAILTGTWGPDQRVSATVFATNQKDECFQEVELRLRSQVSAHVNVGYEITYKSSQSAGAYVGIVRWNGAVGNFTRLSSNNGAQFGVKNGDVVSATIVGNVITGYKNGVQVVQATDNQITTGNPGIGFNLEIGSAGCSGTNGDYGFTTFTANDTPRP